MLGTTSGEHRTLTGVETVSLFGYGVRFVLLGCCKCFIIGITSYSIVYLSRWRSVEALRRDFLYTTKLESKFILTSYQSTPPGSLVRSLSSKGISTSKTSVKGRHTGRVRLMTLSASLRIVVMCSSLLSCI